MPLLATLSNSNMACVVNILNFMLVQSHFAGNTGEQEINIIIKFMAESVMAAQHTFGMLPDLMYLQPPAQCPETPNMWNATHCTQ